MFAFFFRPVISDFQLPARSSSGRVIKRPANYREPDPDDVDEGSECSDSDENFVFTFAYDNELDLVSILQTLYIQIRLLDSDYKKLKVKMPWE